MFSFSDKRPRDDYAFASQDESLIRAKKKPRPLPLRALPITTHGRDLADIHPFPAQFLLPSTLIPADSSEDDDKEDISNKCLGHGIVNSAYNNVQSQGQGYSSPAVSLDTAMELDVRSDCQPLSSRDNIRPLSVSMNHSEGIQLSSVPCNLINQYLHINEGCMTTPTHSHFTMNMAAHTESITMPSSSDPACKNQNSGKDEKADCGHGRHPLSLINQDGNTLQDSYSASADNHGQNKAPLGVAKAGPLKGKTMLSMGYRADCDKCRRKVPGHYSHLIQT